MMTVFLRPRDKKIAKNTAKTALLATAALAMPYAVTPSPLTVVCTAATAMVQNRAFHDFRAVGVPLAQVVSSNIPGLAVVRHKDRFTPKLRIRPRVSPATSWERGARRERDAPMPPHAGAVVYRYQLAVGASIFFSSCVFGW